MSDKLGQSNGMAPWERRAERLAKIGCIVVTIVVAAVITLVVHALATSTDL